MLFSSLILLTIGALFGNLWLRIDVFRKTGWMPFTSGDIAVSGAIVGAILLFTYLGFILSNRLVGPIFRLVREATKVAEGKKNVVPVTFRKNDHFHELADVYNKIVIRLADAEKRAAKNYREDSAPKKARRPS